MMDRRVFIAGGVVVLGTRFAAEGQQARSMARIGMLGLSPSDPLIQAFKQGLRDLGYVEGQNISIEHRWTETNIETLNALALELVDLKVDVIVAGSRGAVAAKRATNTIPIVMPIITDPVRLGLVASLARPGGNATGLATQNDELPGKWIGVLKELLPKVRAIAFLVHPTYDGGVQVKGAEAAARSAVIQLQVLNIERTEDFATAFAQIQQKRAEAVIVSSSPIFYEHRSRVAEFVASHRLPAVYHQGEFVSGPTNGLMSYGPDFRDLFRRSATYVDKILRGAKPADLPVEQPTKFELVINLKTAKALGLTIPPSLLLRADQVIE